MASAEENRLAMTDSVNIKCGEAVSLYIDNPGQSPTDRNTQQFIFPF
jgi:hypothetical protein